MQIQSSAILEKFFVDSDLPDEGYNNEDFYKGSANRMRYLLVTMDLGTGNPELEDNRFYG